MAKKKSPAIIDLQRQAAHAAMPYYGPLLQWMAQQAGLQMPGMGTPGIAGPVQPQPMQATQPATPAYAPRSGTVGYGAKPQATTAAGPNQMALAQMQPQASIGPNLGRVPMGGQDPYAAQGLLPNSALGIYGQNPADVFRMQQAEEDVDRFLNRGNASLQARFARQGIGDSATAAAAQARLAQAGQHQLGDFRRQLAIQAGQEQERRMQQLFSMLPFGAGQGGQAQQVYAQRQQAQQQQQGMNLQSLMALAGMFV